MGKKCYKCKQEKELNLFGNSKRYKDGKNDICKECRKNYNFTQQEQIKEYRYKNKEKHKIKSKKWQENNPQRVKELSKLNNSKKSKEQIKQQNKISMQYRINWSKNQYKTNPVFKLSQLFRIRFLDALKNKNNKVKSVIELLGCSVEESKLYLEKQFKPEMTWENHGLVWEIDHIKPCSKFDLTQLEEQMKCFHYTNLQPLFKSENRIKKDNY